MLSKRKKRILVIVLANSAGKFHDNVGFHIRIVVVNFIWIIICSKHFCFLSVTCRCLKKYCECFSNGVSCSSDCSCEDCANVNMAAMKLNEVITTKGNHSVTKKQKKSRFKN